jgi:hypothetical protein
MRRTVRVPRWTERWRAARLMPYRPRPEWWRRAGAVVAVVALLAATATAVLRIWVEPDGQLLDPPLPGAAAGRDAALPSLAYEPPLPDQGVEPYGPAADQSAAAAAIPPTVSPRPTVDTKPAAPPAPSRTVARYAAVSGESCGQTSTSGYYTKGWFKDWYARSSGGWTGGGCGGRMIAVPMSGDAHVDDPDNVIVWWFAVPTPSNCDISVHVPGTGNVLDAAGAPATYLVLPTKDGTGTPVGQFEVDQVHNQGRWLAVGGYRTASGQLSVRMVTRGIDWGPGREGAHLGVSALRVTC